MDTYRKYKVVITAKYVLKTDVMAICEDEAELIIRHRLSEGSIDPVQSTNWDEIVDISEDIDTPVKCEI